MSNLLPLNEILAQLDGHALKDREVINQLAERIMIASKRIADHHAALKLAILDYEQISAEVNAQITGLNTRIDEMLKQGRPNV